LVAAGANVILVSTNGADWVYSYTGDDQTSFWEVAYGNGVFVTVGYQFVPWSANALILTSSDGVAWNRSTIVSNALYGVGFLNGRFLAVGKAGTMLASTDGLHWDPIVSGTSNDLYGVGFGNGLYVAVGDYTIITSSDGLDWANRSPPEAGWLKTVAYGQGKFIAAGRATLHFLESSDGLSWTPSDPPLADSIAEAEFYSVIYAHGTFMAAGGLLATSTDGSNWTQRSTVTTGGWFGSTFWNDTFIVVGAGIIQSQPFAGPKRPSRFVVSPKSQIALTDREVSFNVLAASWPPLGFQWVRDGQPMSGKTNTSLTFVATLANAGDYSVVATNSFGTTTSSVANLTVVGRTTSLRPSMPPATVGDDVTLFVPTSSNSVVAYQWRANKQIVPDATLATFDINNVQLPNATTYDVIVTNGAGAVTNRPLALIVEPYRDHPLYHWNDRTPPGLSNVLSSPFGLSSGWLGGVSFGNNVFVTVGSIGGSDFGVVLSSADGKTWIYRGTPGSLPSSFFNLYDVAFGNGVFVAVGWLESIYSSTNGADWVRRRTGVFGYYDRVVFRDGFFWAGRTGGPTFRSTDGVVWQSSPSWPGYSGLPISAAGISATISTSPNGVLFSTDSINWALAYSGDLFLSDVAFGNGSFVAVGQHGVIVQSAPLARIDWDSSQSGRLAIRGLMGRQYRIEQRESFTSTSSWSPLATFTLSNNPVLLPVNLTTQESGWFYRALLLP
jgi:hypothetical protein